MGRLPGVGRWESKKRRLNTSRSGRKREVPLHRHDGGDAGPVRPRRPPRATWAPRAPDDLLFPSQGGAPAAGRATSRAHLQARPGGRGLRKETCQTLRRSYSRSAQSGSGAAHVLRAISGEAMSDDPALTSPRRRGDPDIPGAGSRRLAERSCRRASEACSAWGDRSTRAARGTSARRSRRFDSPGSHFLARGRDSVARRAVALPARRVEAVCVEGGQRGQDLFGVLRSGYLLSLRSCRSWVSGGAVLATSPPAGDLGASVQVHAVQLVAEVEQDPGQVGRRRAAGHFGERIQRSPGRR